MQPILNHLNSIIDAYTKEQGAQSALADAEASLSAWRNRPNVSAPLAIGEVPTLNLYQIPGVGDICKGESTLTLILEYTSPKQLVFTSAKDQSAKTNQLGITAMFDVHDGSQVRVYKPKLAGAAKRILQHLPLSNIEEDFFDLGILIREKHPDAAFSAFQQMLTSYFKAEGYAITMVDVLPALEDKYQHLTDARDKAAELLASRKVIACATDNDHLELPKAEACKSIVSYLDNLHTMLNSLQKDHGRQMRVDILGSIAANTPPFAARTMQEKAMTGALARLNASINANDAAATFEYAAHVCGLLKDAMPSQSEILTGYMRQYQRSARKQKGFWKSLI